MKLFEDLASSALSHWLDAALRETEAALRVHQRGVAEDLRAPEKALAARSSDRRGSRALVRPFDGEGEVAEAAGAARGGLRACETMRSLIQRTRRALDNSRSDRGLLLGILLDEIDDLHAWHTRVFGLASRRHFQARDGLVSESVLMKLTGDVEEQRALAAFLRKLQDAAAPLRTGIRLELRDVGPNDALPDDGWEGLRDFALETMDLVTQDRTLDPLLRPATMILKAQGNALDLQRILRELHGLLPAVEQASIRGAGPGLHEEYLRMFFTLRHALEDAGFQSRPRWTNWPLGVSRSGR